MVKIQSRQSTLRRATRRRQFLILGTFLVASMVYMFTRTTPSDVEVHKKNLLQVEVPAAKPKPPNAMDALLGKVSCGGHHAASCAACSNPEKAAEWCNGDCMWNDKEKLCEPIGLVSCGGHYAPSCEKCTQGHGASWCNGDCQFDHKAHVCKVIPSLVHSAYRKISENPDFQQVRTEKAQAVNIILAKRPMSPVSKRIYQNYKDDILFLGISSFENYPLNSPNPFSSNFSNEEYRSLFPGWLTMMRHPEEYFTTTKTILMSQSDFQHEEPLRFYKRNKHLPKKYDFVFSGTDQNVDNDCVGWASFAKNWTFMLEALEVMCSPEFNLTGVLIANTNKKGTRSCDLPPACKGKMLQTKFLPNQSTFFEYTMQSHFMMVPQIYDASPRVVSQALALNVPVLMNRNIVGGWKYLNNMTGEGFHDMSDFKEQLAKIVKLSRQGSYYQPQQFLTSNYGTEHSGKKFREWVETNFPGRVQFPEDSKYIVPWGS